MEIKLSLAKKLHAYMKMYLPAEDEREPLEALLAGLKETIDNVEGGQEPYEATFNIIPDDLEEESEDDDSGEEEDDAD